MSEKTNDGATEFPKPNWTMRDWFAGQALNGRISNRTIVRGLKGPHKMTEAELLASAAATARRAYQYADAMLAEREKGANK